jgi:hypothetical protein
MAETALTAGGGKQMKAVPATCPFRSQPFVTPNEAAYLPPSSLASFAGLKSHPAIHAQTLAAFRGAKARSHQKRGPPLTIAA